MRRPAVSERRWPETPNFKEAAKSWGADGASGLLMALWQGCDRLLEELIAPVGGASENDRNLERDLTQHLVPRVRNALPQGSTFRVEHEVFEVETQKSDKAQPPQYDIGFISLAYPRVIFPVETKVLRTDSAVTEYIKEVTGNYLTCRYAPFSPEGGLLGYLLKGTAKNALANIAKKLGVDLHAHPDFADRPHRTSDHSRAVPKGKPYSKRFRCHHMILYVGAPL